MSMMICVFKQKTAYEMRISDWSSDVCSSDLPVTSRQHEAIAVRPLRVGGIELQDPREQDCGDIGHAHGHSGVAGVRLLDRIHRSEERSVGKECVSTCRFRR